MKTSPSLVKKLIFSFLWTVGTASITQASLIVDDYVSRSRIDFETLVVGVSPTTGTESWAAWTGSATVKGAAPSASTVNTSNVALTETGAARQAGFSSKQVNPFTAQDDTIFFSAWIYRGSGSSGARVTIDDVNTGGGTTGKLAGFGITDDAQRRFTFYNGATNSSISSDIQANNNTWYELALVIKIDNTDISKSLGSLYVRNVTAGSSAFSLVTFDEGATTSFTMSWFTDERNARDSFSYWRYDNFRSSAQIDNLTAGVVGIPEPGTVALSIGGLVFLRLLKGRATGK